MKFSKIGLTGVFRSPGRIAIAVVLSIMVHAASAADWAPDKGVTIIVGTAPGGGADRTARMAQKMLQELGIVRVPLVVLNKPGAGGVIAYNYVNQYAGDPYYLVVTPPTIVTNQIAGIGSVSYTDFSAIALLASEYIAFTVPIDSDIRTIDDLKGRLKKSADAVSIGIGTTTGNTNHIGIARFAHAIGVDPRKLQVVPYRSPSQTLAALLGGHLNAVSLAVSNVLPHVRSGKLRAIALTSPSRATGVLANVPTLKELGLDVVTRQWRAVIGPKGLAENHVVFWEKAFRQLAESPEWQAYLKQVANENTYLDSEATMKFFETEYRETRSILRSIGVAK